MRSEQDAGRASSSRAYKVGTRLATTWLGLYTRSIDPRAASERASAVEFELWEHALVADQRWSPAHAAVSLVLRSAAGVPRDLSWQHAVRAERFAAAPPPAHLLARRNRQRFWVPLQAGHIFDQANGMIEPEKALPYERSDGSDGSFGAAGNAFGLQGGF
jgi:hypothetical protein